MTEAESTTGICLPHTSERMIITIRYKYRELTARIDPDAGEDEINEAFRNMRFLIRREDAV